jgi:hypothetical protein
METLSERVERSIGRGLLAAGREVMVVRND